MKLWYTLFLLSFLLFSCNNERTYSPSVIQEKPTSPNTKTDKKQFDWPPATYKKPTKDIAEEHISTSYPSHWELQIFESQFSTTLGKTRKSIPSTFLSFYLVESGHMGFVVDVYCKKELILAPSFAEFQKQFIEELKSDNSSSIITFDQASNSFDIIYQSKNQDNDFSYQNWSRFIPLNDSVVYNLTYASTDKDFETYLPEAYHIINSFQIEE